MVYFINCANQQFTIVKKHHCLASVWRQNNIKIPWTLRAPFLSQGLRPNGETAHAQAKTFVTFRGEGPGQSAPLALGGGHAPLPRSPLLLSPCAAKSS